MLVLYYLRTSGQDTIGTIMRIRRVHHITVAVRDVAEAEQTFAALFGATARSGPEDVAAFDIRSCEMELGGAGMQLAAPASSESVLSRFLARRGEGIYSIALEVDDLDGAIRELRERGVRVSEPVEAPEGARSAFVAMSATHGVSVQLIEVRGSERHWAAPQAEPEAAALAEPPADQAATGESPRAPIDLTPDEWSDTD
jgi:methylmalonyl-CoA epimerase